MLECRPHISTDIDFIESRECDVMTEPMSILGSYGWTFTLDDEPVAIVGCIMVLPGVGNLWAIISDGARGNGAFMTKLCKEIINDFFKTKALHRAQAMIRPEVKENVRWIKSLGFEYESTMKAITPDKEDLDMYRMVRV